MLQSPNLAAGAPAKADFAAMWPWDQAGGPLRNALSIPRLA